MEKRITKKQKMNSLQSRIFTCVEKALAIDLKNHDIQKHLHFDYGLDSLGYQKLVLFLEDEFGIEITEDIGKSGYFASVEGIATLLSEYFSFNET
jgi:acyl carrier protein